jgi:hypothetical protein
VDLKSRLTECAAEWASAWTAAEGRDVPLTTLAKRVMDDGKFFDGFDVRRYGPTTDTLEKFARYFVSPANWPGGEVPDKAHAFAHVTGVTPPSGSASPDLEAENIGRSAGPAGSDDFELVAPEAKVA